MSSKKVIPQFVQDYAMLKRSIIEFDTIYYDFLNNGILIAAAVKDSDEYVSLRQRMIEQLLCLKRSCSDIQIFMVEKNFFDIYGEDVQHGVRVKLCKKCDDILEPHL